MPTFKSIGGEWWPQDEETKKELEVHGIDHLGVHVSEDPYIKNLEFVTGIPRKELLGQQTQAVMNNMQMQMMKTQQAMALAMAGDQEGAKKLLAGLSSSIEPPLESKPIDDKKVLASEEFSATMRPKKKRGRKPYKHLQKRADNTPSVNSPVESVEAHAAGVASGFGKFKEEE